MPIKNYLPQILIIVLGCLLFMPFLGSVHLFDWDENIFAESAREMLVTGNFYKVQSNYLPFEEKPPFFFWLQAGAMSVFGVNEFAARFPNAIIGIATLLLLYFIGNKYFSKGFGLWWALAYLGSFLPHFYFRTALIDPTFNLFIFSAVFILALFATTDKAEKSLRTQRLLLAGALTGLAILTKGPVAFLIVLLTALGYMLVKKNFKLISLKEAVLFLTPMTLIASTWFVVEAIINGPWFIKEFILYQIYVFKQPHSGHSGPFFFHFVVLMLGCFPVSLYIFKAFRKQSEDQLQQNIKLVMMLLLAAVLLIFSIVKTKLVHYSSLCYFPISFLAAYTIYQFKQGKLSIGSGFRNAVLMMGILVSAVLLGANLFLLKKDDILPSISPYINDNFALGNLSTPLPMQGWEPAIGALYLAAILASVLLMKRNFIQGTLILFISTILVVQATTYTIVPKIEEMIQGEAIRFYREKGKEDAYVWTYGYKSFAYLFYGEKAPGYRPESIDEQWLLHGEVDKPVYMVAKVLNCKPLDENPNFKRLYEKSGYVFYKRSLE